MFRFRHIQVPLFMGLLSCQSTEDRPERFIEFREFMRFQQHLHFADAGMGLETGFTGSDHRNNLFIVYTAIDSASVNREIVDEIDLGSREIDTRSTVSTDFTTKRPEVIDEELVVIGSQYMTSYAFSSVRSVTQFEHGLTITQFGSAISGSYMYFWGGDFTGIFSANVYKSDGISGDPEPIVFLPHPKTWANGAIVDEQLFIFGGQEQFRNTPPNDIILSLDIGENAVWTGHLPQRIGFSSAAGYEDLIYVSGGIYHGENEFPFPGVDDFDIYFGVFDTGSFRFHEWKTNLSSEEGRAIWSITIVGNQLFALYGDLLQPNDLLIMVADL